MARLLRLERESGRTGSDVHDESGNHYELKSTTVRGVGTGRDVGRIYLDRMRTRYSVVANGENTVYGFQIRDVWVLHPEDCEEWVSGYEARIRSDEVLIERIVGSMTDKLSVQEVTRLRYLVNRGATYNNPKISLAYVRVHGTRLITEDPAAELRTLVTARPIRKAQRSEADPLPSDPSPDDEV